MARERADAGPFESFRFQVAWDGRPVPGIVRVSPLRVLLGPHEEPPVRHLPVILERYRTDDDAFESWARQAEAAVGRGSGLERVAKDVEVRLGTSSSDSALTFVIERCVPVEYVGLGHLDANSDEPAVESLTLSHSGWRTE